MLIALILITSLVTVAGFFFVFQERQKSALIRGQFDRAENEIDFLRQEKEKTEQKYSEKIDYLQDKILHFEKQNELLIQEKEMLSEQRKNWQKEKEVVLLQLSEDLMRKNSEQQNIFSESLFKNFESVASKLHALDCEVKKSSDEINKTRNALLSPGGAGRTAEITLENILKSSNLLEKESLNGVGDYILQSHFGSDLSSEAKRPDAIIFLPDNQIVVIDSKSSPHFLELADCKNIEEEKEILGKIKTKFRRHIEDLKRKDYANFLFEELRTKNSSDYKIFLVMFLQTEQMLEVIKKSDPEFERKAFEAGIIVVTPVGLIHLLSSMKFVIDRVKQEKNIEVLKVEMRKLLDSLVMIVKESGELGKSLNKALSGYNKLAKNLNRATALSKNISELGIEGKKSAEMKSLEEFIVDEDVNS
jgi:DNA recombination protein RmuC